MASAGYFLFFRVCSCQQIKEMCKKKSKDPPEKSHADNLEGVPGLFEALTAGNNEEDIDKWTIVTFPEEFEKFSNKEEKTHYALSKC